MNRYYCFPDIHGCNDLLQEALQFVYRENPDGGKIIFLGDYIDRGPDNDLVLQTVMNPPENWEFICLKGNHEEIFVDAARGIYNFYDYNAYLQIKKMENYREIFPWMKNCKLFHIEDKNVFAHAFYDDNKLPENQREHDCVWTRFRDSQTYFNDNQGFYLTHGHTPRKDGPIFAENRVNMDAGAVFFGRFVIAEYEKGKQGPQKIYEFKKKE